MFQSATIEGIAAFLRADSTPEPEIFVPLKDDGAGPAFYCVHEIMGEVMMFRHLAKLLDADQRFFGVQFPPEQRTPEFVLSIEAIAARYVDALLAFQPRGPYFLGGWSAGATIALEMAQQLQTRGHVVELLVAIDAAPPNSGVSEVRKNPLYYAKLVQNLPRWISDDLMATFSWRKFFRRAGRRLSSPVKRAFAARGGMQAMVKYNVNKIVIAGDCSERAKVFIEALYNALTRYKPKPYKGRVVLYKATTQDLVQIRAPERVWRALATDVDVVNIRGTHVSVLDERHCEPLAQDLRARLRTFQNSSERLSRRMTALKDPELVAGVGDKSVDDYPVAGLR